jgi:hypothetical protein
MLWIVLFLMAMNSGNHGMDFFYGRFAWDVGGVEADIPWTDEVNMDFLPRL